MDPQPTALTLAIALAAGAAAQSLARQVHLPGIVVLLAAGAVLGPELAGWVDPSALGGGLVHLIGFGVAVVLFQGGLNLDWERLRRQESAIWRLVSAGAFGTLAGAAALAWFLLGWEWRTAVLFGSVVIVTGPTVVGPLLRDVGLHPRVRTLLEAEGVLLDPIGALLAAFVLQAVTVPAVGALASEAVAVAGSVAFGLLAGIAVGLALAAAVHFRVAVAAGHDNAVVLTVVILAFELCDFLVPQSGFTAVVVIGIVLANVGSRIDPSLRDFTNPLTVVLVGPLVVLLAADVSLNDVRALGIGGFAVVAGLVLIVRPLGVLAATAGLGITGSERTFLAWMAPRGLVAAVVASLTAATLDAGGGAGGGALRALVFLTIAGTVVLAGLTARPLAWALGLVRSGRDRVAVAGATGLGLALATALRRAEVPVVVLDADPIRARAAEKAGVPVVLGDPADEAVLRQAEPERVGAAVGLTADEERDRRFVHLARSRFGVPAGYVGLTTDGGSARFPGGTPEPADAEPVEPVFDGVHDAELWDLRWQRREVALEEMVYGRTSRSAAAGVDSAPPVAVEPPRPVEAEGLQAEPGLAGPTELGPAELGPADPTARAPDEVHPKVDPPEPGRLAAGSREVGPGDAAQESYVLLTVRRGLESSPLPTAYAPRRGDFAAAAIYRPERARALALLAARGWMPAARGSHLAGR